jgi:transposase
MPDSIRTMHPFPRIEGHFRIRGSAGADQWPPRVSKTLDYGKRCADPIFRALARGGMMPAMSTDRFDHKVDRRFKTEASRGARVEVITGVDRRRDWTDEEKLAIVAESSEDGVVISEVARRHGLRPQQLFGWRNEFRRREAARLQRSGAPGAAGAPAFAPVMIAHERPAVAAPVPAQAPR